MPEPFEKLLPAETVLVARSKNLGKTIAGLNSLHDAKTPNEQIDERWKKNLDRFLGVELLNLRLSKDQMAEEPTSPQVQITWEDTFPGWAFFAIVQHDKAASSVFGFETSSDRFDWDVELDLLSKQFSKEPCVVVAEVGNIEIKNVRSSDLFFFQTGNELFGSTSLTAAEQLANAVQGKSSWNSDRMLSGNPLFQQLEECLQVDKNSTNCAMVDLPNFYRFGFQEIGRGLDKSDFGYQLFAEGEELNVKEHGLLGAGFCLSEVSKQGMAIRQCRVFQNPNRTHGGTQLEKLNSIAPCVLNFQIPPTEKLLEIYNAESAENFHRLSLPFELSNLPRAFETSRTKLSLNPWSYSSTPITVYLNHSAPEVGTDQHLWESWFGKNQDGNRELAEDVAVEGVPMKKAPNKLAFSRQGLEFCLESYSTDPGKTVQQLAKQILAPDTDSGELIDGSGIDVDFVRDQLEQLNQPYNVLACRVTPYLNDSILPGVGSYQLYRNTGMIGNYNDALKSGNVVDRGFLAHMFARLRYMLHDVTVQSGAHWFWYSFHCKHESTGYSVLHSKLFLSSSDEPV